MKKSEKAPVPPSSLVSEQLSYRKEILAVLAAVAAAALCIAPSLSGGFLNWDDDRFVVDNEKVSALSAENLADAFSGLRFESYQPLHLVSYMIDGSLWPGNAPLYRLHNLLLYGAGVALLFLLLRRLGFARLPALAGTLLFATAPYRAESVAWISARKDVLMLLFLFGAWHLHLSAEPGAKHRIPARIGSILLYGCALLSKSSAMVFPVMVLAADVGVRRISLRRSVLSMLWYVPFALTAAVVVPLVWQNTNLVQQNIGGPWERVLLVGWSVAHYVKTAAFPFFSAPIYAEPSVEILRNGAVAAILSVAGMVLLVWVRRRKQNSVAVPVTVGTMFLGALLPFLNVVPLYYLRADRYLLLPSVGLAVGAAFFLKWAGERRAAGRQLMAAGLWGWIAIMGAACAIESTYWRDSVSLWEHSVAREPDAFFARLKLGETLRNAGRPGDSVKQYRAAKKLRPLSPTALGGIFWGSLLEDMAETKDTDTAAAEKLTYSFIAAADDAARLQRLRNYLRTHRRPRAAAVVAERLSQ